MSWLIPIEWASYPLWLALSLAMPVTLGWWVVFVSRRWGTGSLIRDYRLSFRWIDLLAIPIAFAAIWFFEPVVAYVAVLVFGDVGGAPTNAVAYADPLMMVPDVVLTVLVAPIIEEIVFRGMLQPSLKRRFDGDHPDADRRYHATNWAVILTAVLFASMHLPQIADGVNGVVLGAVTLFSGVVFGALAMATGRTAPSIVVHAAVNATAVGTAYGIIG